MKVLPNVLASPLAFESLERTCRFWIETCRLVDQDPADAPTLVWPGPGHVTLLFAQLVGDPTNKLVPTSMTFCAFHGVSSTDTLATEPVLSACLAAGEDRLHKMASGRCPSLPTYLGGEPPSVQSALRIRCGNRPSTDCSLAATAPAGGRVVVVGELSPSVASSGPCLATRVPRSAGRRG